MRENLFLSVAFFLGCCAVLSIDLFNILFIFSLLVNIAYNPKVMWQHLCKEKAYFMIPLIFMVWQMIVILTTSSSVQPSYWIFETVLLSFLLLPLYLLSLKEVMTTKLLKQGLLAFVIGVVLFNTACLFQLSGWNIFNQPEIELNKLYESRFAGNKHILGGFVLLEPQALYLSIASIISYGIILFERKRLYRNIFIALFPLCLLFLSLTVTKASILGFLIGVGILSVVYIRRHSFNLKGLAFIGTIVIIMSMPFFISDAYAGRIESAENEIESVFNGEFEGGSIAPRVALLTEFIDHLDEFAIKGLGIYSDKTTKQWYLDSSHSIGNLNNIHNSFLEYWIIGGIPGLIFILSFFFRPIYTMFKTGKYSFLTLSILSTLVLTNSACALLLFNDSKALILFFLALGYFYNAQFSELTGQKKECTNALL